MTRQLPKPVAVPLGWVICGVDKYLKESAR